MCAAVSQDATNPQVRFMRQTCTDVLEIVVRFVPRTSGDLTNFLKPFFELLKDVDKDTQACAGLCVAGIIQNSNKGVLAITTAVLHYTTRFMTHHPLLH